MAKGLRNENNYAIRKQSSNKLATDACAVECCEPTPTGCEAICAECDISSVSLEFSGSFTCSSTEPGGGECTYELLGLIEMQDANPCLWNLAHLGDPWFLVEVEECEHVFKVTPSLRCRDLSLELQACLSAPATVWWLELIMTYDESSGSGTGCCGGNGSGCSNMSEGNSVTFFSWQATSGCNPGGDYDVNFYYYTDDATDECDFAIADFIANVS